MFTNMVPDYLVVGPELEWKGMEATLPLGITAATGSGALARAVSRAARSPLATPPGAPHPRAPWRRARRWLDRRTSPEKGHPGAHFYT